jgi:hypothetical protein
MLKKKPQAIPGAYPSFCRTQSQEAIPSKVHPNVTADPPSTTFANTARTQKKATHALEFVDSQRPR